MKIICHRGLWEGDVASQNSLAACAKGLLEFDGIEIDLKNYFGEIVLAHNPIAKKQIYTKLESLFMKNSHGFYALNIKEDGLGLQLKYLIKKYKIKNYMCFDLSQTEIILYKKLGLKTYKRYGDLDPLSNESANVILDIYNNKNQSYYIQKLLKSYSPKKIMIISPELHKLPWKKTWAIYRTYLNSNDSFLCTDLPYEARKYFET